MVGFRTSSDKKTKVNPSHPRLYNIIADVETLKVYYAIIYVK